MYNLLTPTILVFEENLKITLNKNSLKSKYIFLISYYFSFKLMSYFKKIRHLRKS